MAPRASWKGFLQLSLVSVPVQAYSVNESGGTIRMNQLHAECNSRIKLKTVCPSCGEVPRSDLVKGYEFAKDQYVIIDLDELEKLRSKDESHAIRIKNFVPPSAIDALHFSDSSYFLLPDGDAGQKPYALFREAMIGKKLICIANVVLHNKEQLVMVRPVEGLLCMTVLRFSSQLKSPAMFEDDVAEHDISKEEFKLAETLIDQITADSFDIEEHKDVYHERLTQLIEAKVAGKELVQAPETEVKSTVNLMDALKASVAQVKNTPDTAKAEKTPTKKKVAKRGKAVKKKAKS